MNQIQVAGNAIKDATIKFLDGGKAVCNFSIADNGFEKGAKTTLIHDVSIWGKRAEHAAEFIKKGTPVTVFGKLLMPTIKGEVVYQKVEASDFTASGRAGAPQGTADHSEEVPF